MRQWYPYQEEAQKLDRVEEALEEQPVIRKPMTQSERSLAVRDGRSAARLCCRYTPVTGRGTDRSSLSQSSTSCLSKGQFPKMGHALSTCFIVAYPLLTEPPIAVVKGNTVDDSRN